MTAFPIPIQGTCDPRISIQTDLHILQKTTAEKYDVPYANAVSHGPTDLPPSQKAVHAGGHGAWNRRPRPP